MKRLDVLYCKKCGLVLEVEVPCNSECGTPICCGENMVILEAKTADSTVEKHVPIADPAVSEGACIRVGSVPHPMTGEHYIQWIDVINGDYVNRKFLNPGEEPAASFWTQLKPGMTLREYCNIHGLWKNEQK